MAPVTKTETHNVSYQQMLQSIFELEGSISLNEGQLAENSNKTQMSQAQVEQEQVQISHQQYQSEIAQLQKLQNQEGTAQKWSTFGDIMKWVGVGVAACVGALLCETPAGFAILAGVIALTASGVLNKGISALGNALGNAMGGSTGDHTWGNIIAQVIVIAALTIVTAGAEGVYVGLTKAASS